MNNKQASRDYARSRLWTAFQGDFIKYLQSGMSKDTFERFEKQMMDTADHPFRFRIASTAVNFCKDYSTGRLVPINYWNRMYRVVRWCLAEPDDCDRRTETLPCPAVGNASHMCMTISCYQWKWQSGSSDTLIFHFLVPRTILYHFDTTRFNTRALDKQWSIVVSERQYSAFQRQLTLCRPAIGKDCVQLILSFVMFGTFFKSKFDATQTRVRPAHTIIVDPAAAAASAETDTNRSIRHTSSSSSSSCSNSSSSSSATRAETADHRSLVSSPPPSAPTAPVPTTPTTRASKRKRELTPTRRQHNETAHRSRRRHKKHK